MSSTLAGNFSGLKRISLGTPILLMIILAMMILPLPAFCLDIFFTFNIALSIVVLLACVYSQRPLEFSLFPTVLLVSTLLRLALNIASTRVVLLKGHTGGAAAGKVIEAFGHVVIGSNFAVGMVVFAILVIINFVVVTKGAGRISEVSARFTLDAMPGKQMAIDADLNAGIITQDQAKERRQEVAQEADFYGAMDGASKFVRGDAIAGLLILFINIIGGIIIGVAQFNMNVADASRTYIILTIGDGLVAQIPSLVLSTAAAIMVTRVNSTTDMGSAVIQQLFNNPRSILITAGVISSLGIIPGMPHVAFLGLGTLLAVFSSLMNNKQKQEQTKQPALEKDHEEIFTPKELDWDDVNPVDVIGLEIGYRLINLIDNKGDSQLMARIKGIRKKLSQQLGFLIPAVHIKDNLDLPPTHYRISLMGVSAGQAEIYIDKELAINPGQIFGTVDGIACKDPSFGLEAVWINPEQKEYAQSLGYTVVDPSTVIATHLNQQLQAHAAQLLGHEEVQQLLDKLGKSAPKLVEALVPTTLPLSVVVKVLQGLLEEQIPIIDIRTIAETLVEQGAKSQDPGVLITAVRKALKRLIVHTLTGGKEKLSIATLAPELEQILQQSAQMVSEHGVGLEPSLADKLHKAMSSFVQKQNANGNASIVVVSPQIRSMLSHLLRGSVPGLHLLSYQEIPDDKEIQVIGAIGS